MWCLETIIQLNRVASELASEGRPIKEAYALCGIGSLPKDSEDKVEKQEQRKPLKVVA